MRNRILKRAEITDETMKVVAGFSELKRLMISGTDITDVSVQKLKEPAHLNYVDIHGRGGNQCLRAEAPQ